MDDAISPPNHWFAQELEEKATDTFENIADKAADKFREVADQAEQIASRVAEQGREAGDKMQEVAGNLKGVVDKSLKDQPLATLAMAAALGFVFGAEEVVPQRRAVSGGDHV